MKVWSSLVAACACIAMATVVSAATATMPLPGTPLKRADWAELRGPVSTCGIKRYPGIRSFTRHTARQYPTGKVKVIQRVAEPFLQLYRNQSPEQLLEKFGFSAPDSVPAAMKRELVQTYDLTAETSEEELVAILARHGIRMEGAQPDEEAAPPTPDCPDDAGEASVGADGSVEA